MVKFIKKKRVYKKRRVVRRKPVNSFAKRVQAVISKNVESKQVYRNENSTPFNGSITTAVDALQIVPNMGTGVTDHSRIGDQVRGQSITIKGHICSNLTFTGISSCRLGIRMMIVQPKQYSNFGNVQANATTWLALLLKRGASVTAFTGVVPDLYSAINTDAITCHYDKVMYINAPYMATAVGETSVYNSIKFFSRTIKLRNKKLMYDPSIDAGLTPSNYSPVLLVGYVKLDGTGADASNQLSISYNAYLNYEDA